MRCTFASLAFVALAAANPVPAGVSTAITPTGTAPAGCSTDYPGSFEIQVVKGGSKRDLAKRQSTPLTLTLSGGVLMDSQGRTGYVASNNQFQFDDPPQAGAIYTAGFSVCQNGDLALGPDTTWYQCLSGNFYNLYDDNDAAQCSAVHIVVIGSSSGATTTAAAAGTTTASGIESQISDGQVTGSAVTTVTPICQIADGQPQATGCVTQISDGQVQAPTATPAPAPVTQISDGQIQATTAAAVCTEYVDGQPQCTSAAPAPVTTPCTEYKDGQPQCPPTGVSTGWPAPTYGANSSIAQPTPSAQPATGAAVSISIGNQVFALVGGVLAIALL